MNIIYDIMYIVGLSEEPVMQREKEAVGSGGGSTWEAVAAEERSKQQRRRRTRMKTNLHHDENEELEDDEGEENDEGNINRGGGCERQREHPFIVTEPGEVARGKKNGLDYLFHLYEQCREFLMQVQAIAKDRGEKCPTKVYSFFFVEFFPYHTLTPFVYVNLSPPSCLSASSDHSDSATHLCCCVVPFMNRLNNTVLLSP